MAGKTPQSDAAPAPFWRKKLEDLNPVEWESLCDGCGRCCLVKLEDEDTGKVYFTSIACKLFRTDSCRCGDYPGRQAKVPDCIRLTPQEVRTISWLPPTCGYRLVAEGKDLPWWHPLVSGRPETVHEAGVSVRGRVTATEEDVPFTETVEFVVTWPTRWPRGAKTQPK